MLIHLALIYYSAKKIRRDVIMEIFTFFFNHLTIILYGTELLCNIYYNEHKLDSKKFTYVLKISTLILMLINTIVFIAFNYSAIISQFPRL